MKVFVGIVLALTVYNIIRVSFSLGLDDSDLSTTKRSGMAVYTDYKTGVQYMSTQFGGLCVRVDENGKPLKAENNK